MQGDDTLCANPDPRERELREHLPDALKHVVLAAVESQTSTGIAAKMPLMSFADIEIRPVHGRSSSFFAMQIVTRKNADPFSMAVTDFAVSRREEEVAALLLQGCRLKEVAHQLGITSRTVQAHINSMLTKTGSRNRTELVARLLSCGSGA